MNTIYEKLPGVLIAWYQKVKRELPWRQDTDPYHIWVSEIMLQQTRVEAVKGYYARFLQALPTIADLANASQEQLYKLWEGLGYYSRVRNLQKAAAKIMEDHGGIFPREYAAIRSLPGIGPYTAGAIASIAFSQPRAAVDGNVLRVIARLTDDATPVDNLAWRKGITASLERVYPAEAGEFTQALMELGATVCGPNRKPACRECPCAGFCLGYANGTAETLPVKQPKASRRVEVLTCFILSCDGAYGLRKRADRGLLAGMWEFPNVPGRLDAAQAIACVEEMGLIPAEIIKSVEKKHIFTHVEWDMSGIYMEVKERSSGLTWFTDEDFKTQGALPTAFRQFRE